MVGTGASGGYLSDTGLGEDVAALQADSAVLRLGAQVQPVGGAHSAVGIPRGASPAAAYWLAAEDTQISEGDPSIGMIAARSKHVAAFVEVSRQLLLTAANTEAIVRQELRRAGVDAAADRRAERDRQRGPVASRAAFPPGRRYCDQCRRVHAGPGALRDRADLTNLGDELDEIDELERLAS